MKGGRRLFRGTVAIALCIILSRRLQAKRSNLYAIRKRIAGGILYHTLKRWAAVVRFCPRFVRIGIDDINILDFSQTHSKCGFGFQSTVSYAKAVVEAE